jgi:hypothetical protein
MYRIELSPGEQTAFRSIEELAVAIRRGVVTPHARIWHNTSSKWLPIQFHPHYKLAASMQLTSADLAAGAPVQPLELLTLGELVDPPMPAARPAAEPKPTPRPQEPAAQPVREQFRKLVRETREAVREVREPVRETREPVREIRASQPKPSAPKKRAGKSHRSRSGRRALRIALAGSVLLAGAQLALTAVGAARSETVASRPRTHRRLITEPTQMAPQGRPETTAAAVLPLPAVPRPTPRPASKVAEPETSSLGASPAESTPEIEPAPSTTEIVAPRTVNTDSLAPKPVDSTSTKALNGVLRAISGPPTTERSRPKR